MKPMSVRFTIASMLLLTIAKPLSADEPQALAPNGPAHADNEQPPIRLTVGPVAPPAAALKYKLLPPLIDRRAGNAAIFYNKIGLSLTGKGFEEFQTKMYDWLELPLDKLPREEVRTALAQYTYHLDDLDMAARRDQCDWQFPLHDGRNLIMLLLPEVQKSRDYSRLIAMKARLQILDGQYDEAIHTLQTGFALGRQVAEGPTLINGLVGLATCETMLRRVEELIDRAGDVNLYWALTALPRPILDNHSAIEVEMAMLYLSYPPLQDLRSTKRTSQEWQASLEQIVNDLGPVTGTQDWPGRLGLTAMAIRGYPEAKQRLVAEGRTKEEVEAMPVFQVVMIDSMQTYDELRDRMMRWSYVPFWQAERQLDIEEQYLKTEGRRREIVPLASLVLPAIRQSSFAYARTDRHIAGLRVVEALRIYGASHDGKFPASLADITEVPVPEDPVTGKSFEYSVSADTAFLTAPTSTGRGDLGLRYEVKFRK